MHAQDEQAAATKQLDQLKSEHRGKLLGMVVAEAALSADAASPDAAAVEATAPSAVAMASAAPSAPPAAAAEAAAAAANGQWHSGLRLDPDSLSPDMLLPLQLPAPHPARRSRRRFGPEIVNPQPAATAALPLPASASSNPDLPPHLAAGSGISVPVSSAGQQLPNWRRPPSRFLAPDKPVSQHGAPAAHHDAQLPMGAATSSPLHWQQLPAPDTHVTAAAGAEPLVGPYRVLRGHAEEQFTGSPRLQRRGSPAMPQQPLTFRLPTARSMGGTCTASSSAAQPEPPAAPEPLPEPPVAPESPPKPPFEAPPAPVPPAAARAEEPRAAWLRSVSETDESLAHRRAYPAPGPDAAAALIASVPSTAAAERRPPDAAMVARQPKYRLAAAEMPTSYLDRDRRNQRRHREHEGSEHRRSSKERRRHKDDQRSRSPSRKRRHRHRHDSWMPAADEVLTLSGNSEQPAGMQGDGEREHA